jgi:hypothetical protein
VEIVITKTAAAYIRDHGGTVFVRSHPHRCCTGSLTLLDTTTTPPADSADFESFNVGDAGVGDAGDGDGDAGDVGDAELGEVGVRYHGGSSGFPGQLTIELRGLLRRHPVALWDGCRLQP